MIITSLSARRAWIEIQSQLHHRVRPGVALRKESVDRNRDNEMALQEGMKVALRKESVDRNPNLLIELKKQRWSLSARRAWIEISLSGSFVSSMQSLSARRAWIEIETGERHARCLLSRSPQGERG